MKCVWVVGVRDARVAKDERCRLQPSWLSKVKVSWNVKGRTRRKGAVMIGQQVYGVYPRFALGVAMGSRSGK